MPAAELTVLVTTHNRPSCLLRLARYAQASGNPFPLWILDSSAEPAQDPLLAPLRRLRFDPATPPMDKLREALRQVATPYVVVWADDDFLVPNALAAAVDALRAAPEAGAAQGRAVLFGAQQADGAPQLFCQPYLLRAIDAPTGAQRLLDQMRRHAVVNYAVHCTGVLRRHVELCCANGFGYVWAELALGALAAVHGPILQVDQLYLAKEWHGGGDSWDVPEKVRDPFEWIASPVFAARAEAFHACVAAALVDTDGMALDAARQTAKQALWSYLAATLQSKAPGRPATSPSRVKRWARRLPGALRAWRMANAVLPRAQRHADLRLIEAAVGG